MSPSEAPAIQINHPASALPEWAKTCLGSALGLVLLPTLQFALGQSLLLAGGHLNGIAGLIIVMASGAVSLLASYRASGKAAAVLLVSVVAVVATCLSGLIIDTSFDGQEYHFDAVNALANGWNPFRDPEARNGLAPGISSIALWAKHYPQAAWISSATQVAAGFPIETAKTQPLILMVALFLAVIGTCLALGLRAVTSVSIAAVAAANPVILVQLFTRMNDGQLGACAALVGIFGVLWINRPTSWALAGTIAPLVYALNLKFSAFLLVGGVCALLCVLALYLCGWRRALRTGSVLFAASIIGVLVFGAHPYITNTLRESHPLYPLMGPGKVDIMTVNRPPQFVGLTATDRLMISYLGPTSSGYAGDVGLKVPLSVNKSELRSSGEFDARIGGFGPLFSGALGLALVLGVVAALKRPRSREATLSLFAAAWFLALAVVTPEAWWARYVPEVWWAVVLLSLALLLSPDRWRQVAGTLVVGILAIDALLVAASSAAYVGPRTLQVRHQLEAISRSESPMCIMVGAAHARLSLLRPMAAKWRLVSNPPLGCRMTPLAGVFWQSAAGYCECL